ncbi:anti-sigma factor [Methylobacterium sp. JK268]
MSETDDPDLRAAEYVLGTLSADERFAFERDRAADPRLAAAQAAWERRLAPLHEAALPVRPDPATWDAIRAALPGRASAPVVDLAPALRRWRRIGVAASALAAGLALFIAVDRFRPAEPAAQYVAVVNRGGELPALVVRVDTGAGTVQVRALAAETPRERSLELWYIGRDAAPRSLGLVPGGPSARFLLPAAERTIGDGARIAVTVEPPGGSPSGSPTGPVVYSGALVRD